MLPIDIRIEVRHMNGRLLVVVLAVILLLAWAPATAQVADVTPVTEAMLHDPDPADWLNWRRTLDGWGHSPLDQITTENASVG